MAEKDGSGFAIFFMAVITTIVAVAFYLGRESGWSDAYLQGQNEPFIDNYICDKEKCNRATGYKVELRETPLEGTQRVVVYSFNSFCRSSHRPRECKDCLWNEQEVREAIKNGLQVHTRHKWQYGGNYLKDDLASLDFDKYQYILEERQ